jgi:hypothetical protein
MVMSAPAEEGALWSVARAAFGQHLPKRFDFAADYPADCSVEDILGARFARFTDISIGTWYITWVAADEREVFFKMHGTTPTSGDFPNVGATFRLMNRW